MTLAKVIQKFITNERLAQAGYFNYPESTSLCIYMIELPCTERYTLAGLGGAGRLISQFLLLD
jgi:hypothetical protein